MVVGDQTSCQAKPVRSHVNSVSPAGQVCLGPIFRRTVTSPMLVAIEVMQVLAVVCCAPALDASMKYVALLLQGDVRQRVGQMDVAAKAYLDAVVTSPDGQSAYLALSQILLRSGQRGDAATVLERWYARRTADTMADPWWTYPLGFKLSMDGEFEEYRAQVRK